MLFALLFGLLVLAHTPAYFASADQPVERRAAVILWCFSSLAEAVSICACLLAAGSIIVDFWKELRARSRTVLLIVLSAAFAIGVWRIWASPIGGRVIQELMRPVLCLHASIPVIVRTLTALEFVSIASLCLAVVLLGWNIAEKSTSEIAPRIHRMRLLLYSSSAFLGLAVFKLNRWLDCGVIFSKPESGARLVIAYSLGAGLAFASLLFLVFGPLAVQASARLHDLAAAASQQESDFKLEVWRVRNVLPEAPLQDLASIGAALFPIIIAVITGKL